MVTRATDQASTLVEALRRHGARVLHIPLVDIVDDAHGLESLRRLLGDPRTPCDGIVVTSPNGARRVAGVWDRARGEHPPVYVVGPGTRQAWEHAGGPRVAGVADQHVAESVVALLGAGTGHLVVAQGDLARPVLVEGLRAAGWQVTPVTVYRNVACVPSTEAVQAGLTAQVVTLASGSAARSWAQACGHRTSPPVVVMGPVTAEVARQCGLPLVDIADPHTLEGLVAATVRAVTKGRPSAGGSAS